MTKWMLILGVFIASGAQAEIEVSRHGLKNFKSAMPQILFRGGNTDGQKKAMKDSALRGLCQDGFSSAVYLYPGRGDRDKSMSCGGNTIQYKNISWNSDKQVLKLVHAAIQSGQGPVYVHCWHGVHASGYIAAVALRQFCGYSAEQAVTYWNSHVPPSIRYPHVQQKIRDFQPAAGMNLTSAQASRHCP